MHQALRLDPSAIAHLNLADVGEQAFGTPAQQPLLKLDRSKCEHDKNERSRAHNPKNTRKPFHAVPY
jgi:hypothetical protein